MKKTRIHLLPREIAGRVSRSFDARGFLHAVYLERCAARLRQPISQSVGWTLFRFVPIRRRHRAFGLAKRLD